MVADKKYLGYPSTSRISMRTEGISGISIDSMGISVVSILMVGFRAPNIPLADPLNSSGSPEKLIWPKLDTPQKSIFLAG